MKKYIPLLFVVLTIAGFYAYLLYSLSGSLVLLSPAPYSAGLLLLTILFSSLLFLPAYYRLICLFSWKHHAAIRLPLSLLVCWGLLSLSLYLYSLALVAWFPLPPAYADSMEVFRLKGVIVGMLISLLFTLGDFSWFAYYRYAAETLARLQTERRQKELQFDVLRAQLSPHYLFNSLNTASNLMSYNPARAEVFLRQLAANFRFLLQQSQHTLNSLQQELEIVDNFFQLMKVRFGDKIILQKEIAGDCLQKQLPTLALQLLVENAIKHNIASEDKPVIINLKAGREGVSVSNNITLPPVPYASGGIGLRNLRERYAQLSDKQLLMNRTHCRYEVKLPYISLSKKEVYV